MRPRPTLTDYIVIAISPALIMALVGSLVFFLLEVLYQGQYQARLQYVFALFVFAAVLIARISIDEGREKALGFSVALSVAVLLVMSKFVEYSGIFGRLSLVINISLIVLILWCANKLTWDCTVIDEQEDASGEGLLQTAGMDDTAEGSRQANVELEGTSGVDEPETVQQPKGLWQRFVEARRKKHAPGVWVVYFSMAALPIFGIGQGFIFGQDQAGRRWVFKLLVVYVAAALGLLLTTSFLGLRRYLRQRRLEMPAQMAGSWLGVGAVMIVALLLFCLLLPRRNAEYSVSDIPAFAGSPDDLKPNKWGFGNDGPEEDNAERQVKRDDAEKQSDQSGDKQGGGMEKSKGDKSGGKEKSNEKGKQGKEKGDSKGKSEQGKQSENQKQGEKSGGKQKGDKSDEQGEKSGGKQGEQSKSDPEQEKDDSDAKGKSEEKQETDQQGKKQSDRSKSQAQKSESESKSKPSRFDPSKIAQQIGGGIGALLKLVYWLIVLVIVGWFLWRYWDQVREAVANFIKAMKEFWAKLFGGKPEDADEPAAESIDTGPPPRPFSDFPNPFQTEMHARLSVDQLVAYSFEAFEAWAREHGCARVPEQTPHEFAFIVGQSATYVSQDAQQLADLYCRSAFSNDLLPATSLDHLRRLWNQLAAAR